MPDTTPTEPTATINCTYCRKPIEGDPVFREIIDQDRNAAGRMYVRKQRLPFCSAEHGGYEQMAREG